GTVGCPFPIIELRRKMNTHETPGARRQNMAHISILCPQCQSRYQVEPDLRGRAMRCPNPVCRAVFEVKAEAEVGGQEAEDRGQDSGVRGQETGGGKQVSGSVGEMVPTLGGEAVEPVPPADGEKVSEADKPRRASPPWEKMPPPVRRDQAPSEKPI